MYSVYKKWTTAKKQEYNGRLFDSKFEASQAYELDMRKKAGDIKDYKTQVNIPLIVNGYKICDYRIDFIVEHNDGTREFIETKGVAFPVWKIKWRLFEALFTSPNNKLTIIQQGNSFKMKKLKKIKNVCQKF